MRVFVFWLITIFVKIMPTFLFLKESYVKREKERIKRLWSNDFGKVSKYRKILEKKREKRCDTIGHDWSDYSDYYTKMLFGYSEGKRRVCFCCQRKEEVEINRVI